MHRILLVIVAAALLLAGPSAASAADAPLSTRFAQTLRGDVRSVGNTLMTCPSSTSCTRARDRTATGSGLNNDFTMAFVDLDGDSSTTNSSSADLTLPAGATVAWAGLYWGADTSAGTGGRAGSTTTRDRVRFRVPGGSYQTVTGSVLTSSTQSTRYTGFADVTSLVSAGGQYWAGNVAAGTGADRYAGWALIVAYRDGTQPVRRVNVLDGLATVGPGRSLAATVAPFFTPASGAVRTNAGVVAFEGDAGLTGDSLSFNGKPAGDALNPANNIFNSTVSVDGASVTTRNPSYANTLGFDLDSTTATGVLGNGQSSAGLAMASPDETFFVPAFYVVSDEGPAVNTLRPAVSGTAREASVLTATTGAWDGTPSLTYTYEWQRCDAVGASCTAIPGATSASYAVSGADVDGTLRAVVTARNDAGSSAPAASETTLKVTRRPPVNATLPVVSGTVRDGSELSTTLGTWTGTGPFDYTVRWLRCDGADCTSIEDASGTSYTATADDVGHALRSEVTASNSAGFATARSAATREVPAAAPALADAPVVSGVARESETLTATAGAWTGTAPIALDFAWERCDKAGGGCRAIDGAGSSSYLLTPDDVGHRLRVAVTARNAGGTAVGRSPVGDVVTAALARNTAPPTVAGPDGARVLTADPGTWAGTLGPLAYQWQRCSAAGDACADIPRAVERTYSLVDADGGRTLRVAVTMTNAAGPSTALSAVTARMPYPAPVNLVPPAISGRALRGALLTARPGAWRALGTPVRTFAWQRCDADGEACVAIAGAAASTYRAAAADLGHRLRAAVTVANDGGRTTVMSAPTGVVAEPPPPPVVSPTPTATTDSSSSSPPPATGGVAGTSDEKPGVASVPGSLVAPSSCQLLRGTRRQPATLPGIGRVVLQAAVNGAVTPSSPMRLNTSGGRAASVRYTLDGTPLADGRRARVAPARLGTAGVHTVVAILRPRTGAEQSVSLPLRTAVCLARFTGRRSAGGLRLRVDARTALTDIAFTVPSRLLPRQTRESRPVGTLRLLVAGSPLQTVGLVLPAKGTAPALLGAPSVRYSSGGVVISGLPAGTAAVELRLTRTAALDGAAPRGAITLRARVRREGARVRTLSLHTR